MASGQTEGKRNANMDLLRMVSMMMVTMLHALTKSDLLLFMGREVPVNGWIAWGFEALSVSAVNVFMLISGYFLISSKFNGFFTDIMEAIKNCRKILEKTRINKLKIFPEYVTIFLSQR